jgi:hypothetical protein
MMKNPLQSGAVHAMLALSILSLSLASPVKSAALSVPFKAQINAYDQVGTDAVCPASPPSPPLASTILGTGVGTHLGRFTANMHDCFTLAGAGLYVFQNGLFTLTAADGSELHGTYSGQLVATPTTNQDAVFDLHGTYEITGGTKRFQNASGSGLMAGKDNILTGQVTVALTGTINF